LFKMSEKKLEIYCITNKRIKDFKNDVYKLAWVGQEKPPNNYLKCDNKNNIFFKEKYYSELTFQYWYWKNILNLENKHWVGFCQKRRFWKKESNSKNVNTNNFFDEILFEPHIKWENYESIICKKISVNKIKKIKMLKRSFRTLVKNPLPFFFEKKQTIKFHFDMHHGHGNLDKAIDVMSHKDREEFRNFVNSETSFNPHIMFISRSKIMDKWFKDLFPWLLNCEKIFGFNDLSGYDTTRLYAYLAERYLSFWFKKYTKALEWDWLFFDNISD
tara:strand:- start:3181 stop:3999 length:819 start_codon:yes stop_codon:yes gene_type:complete